MTHTALVISFSTLDFLTNASFDKFKQNITNFYMYI